jgi:hypothetical protein
LLRRGGREGARGPGVCGSIIRRIIGIGRVGLFISEWWSMGMSATLNYGCYDMVLFPTCFCERGSGTGALRFGL